MRGRKSAEIRVRALVLRHSGGCGSKPDKAAIGGLWWVGEGDRSRREVVFRDSDEEEDRENSEEKVELGLRDGAWTRLWTRRRLRR